MSSKLPNASKEATLQVKGRCSEGGAALRWGSRRGWCRDLGRQGAAAAATTACSALGGACCRWGTRCMCNDGGWCPPAALHLRGAHLTGLTVTPTEVDLLEGSSNRASAPILSLDVQLDGTIRRYFFVSFTTSANAPPPASALAAMWICQRGRAASDASGIVPHTFREVHEHALSGERQRAQEDSSSLDAVIGRTRLRGRLI
jgi:hypothetical protein